MQLRTIRLIAAHELLINMRNKWMQLFAAAFALLVLAISYFGLVTIGNTGFQGFARTSASLLNLVLYIIPLMALTMGTLTFTSRVTFGEMLFSQPVLRSDILMGKVAGLFFSMAIAMFLGFGLAGLIIAANTGTDRAYGYPALVLFSLVLALIFICVAAAISTACRRKTQAFGVVLFVWFFFLLFYDLLVIGGTFLFKEKTANQFIFLSLFGNPVDIVRVSALLIMDGKEIFGPAGAALLKFLGGKTTSLILLAAASIAWIALPLFASRRLLDRQDI
ncbi:MAG TPA: ABC transporter permease subunit [Acidobacteriota bacterium]|nr:ABC transporter permease subunit [Acidobacteriota bacterium]